MYLLCSGGLVFFVLDKREGPEGLFQVPVISLGSGKANWKAKERKRRKRKKY